MSALHLTAIVCPGGMCCSPKGNAGRVPCRLDGQSAQQLGCSPRQVRSAYGSKRKYVPPARRTVSVALAFFLGKRGTATPGQIRAEPLVQCDTPCKRMSPRCAPAYTSISAARTALFYGAKLVLLARQVSKGLHPSLAMWLQTGTRCLPSVIAPAAHMCPSLQDTAAHMCPSLQDTAAHNSCRCHTCKARVPLPHPAGRCGCCAGEGAGSLSQGQPGQHAPHS